MRKIFVQLGTSFVRMYWYFLLLSNHLLSVSDVVFSVRCRISSNAMLVSNVTPTSEHRWTLSDKVYTWLEWSHVIVSYSPLIICSIWQNLVGLALLVRALPEGCTTATLFEGLSQYTALTSIVQLQISDSKQYAYIQMKSSDEATLLLNSSYKAPIKIGGKDGLFSLGGYALKITLKINVK